ncbi:MAG: hypothetical protein MK066_03775 [Crocinitomicaceae bacterium]|nr:hypothetical protein [Crocinitomicaceae bacterium]
MRFLLPFLVLTSFPLFSQNLDIQKWQLHHPDVVFVEQEIFSNFTDKQVEQLGDKVIVYNSTISMIDISLYESASKSSYLENTNTLIEPSASTEVKTWLAHNGDVKIITRSYYNSLSQERKDAYNNVNALILIGETLTIGDIKSYNP